MNSKDIIDLIPDKLLEDLAIETSVDKYAKKLNGKVVFRLLLHCILSYKDNSLRRMESHFEKVLFSYVNQDAQNVRYSSISERLKTMNVTFFKKLYQKCVAIYGPLIQDDNSSYIRYDSTIVSLSSQLLKIGYNLKNGDASKLNLVKYSIGLSEIPTIAHFYTDQKYSNENPALKQTILAHKTANTQAIRIFDRGIDSRNTYDELIENDIPFISRIKTNCKSKVVESSRILKEIETPTLIIKSDEIVYLFSEKARAKRTIRLIKAIQIETGKDIFFITSITDLDTETICTMYRKRWDIEVFFKFLKQELNFSHFINRSANGIEIILYVTLIAAILLLVYKKCNKLKGYKIMKQKFLIDLEWEIMRDIVIVCGGDPNKIDELKGKPPNK